MKSISKLLAIILCLAMLAAVMCGCGEKTPSTDGTPAEDTSGDTETTETHNYAGAYASLDPDTVIMTADGKEILWRDFFYFVEYYTTYAEYYSETITDWTAEIYEGTTYQDYVLSGAAQWMAYAAAVEAGAAEMKLELDDDDNAAIEAQWDTYAEQYGSKEAFIEQMASYYCTEELYNYMLKISTLADKCYTSLYGANGADLTDEQVEEYNAQDGYLMAEHILICTTYTDENGNTVEYSEEEKAEKKELAGEILLQLQAASDEELPGLFEELMNEYSEDTGLTMYPNGYLFVEGDMVSEFYEGTLALEIGQVSDIIETSYGYHIIYRLPIDCDTTPQAYSSYLAQGNTGYSLRALTATSMFDAVVDGWIDDIEVEYTDAYNNIDLNTLYAFG